MLDNINSNGWYPSHVEGGIIEIDPKKQIDFSKVADSFKQQQQPENTSLENSKQVVKNFNEAVKIEKQINNPHHVKEFEKIRQIKEIFFS